MIHQKVLTFLRREIAISDLLNSEKSYIRGYFTCGTVDVNNKEEDYYGAYNVIRNSLF